MRWSLAGTIAFVLLLIGGALYLDHRESNACEARGGRMVGTGTYTTTYVQSGNVLLPITTENTACSVP